ncbi:monovalent cation/H+ antiporter subunit D [Larsenimonas rhizosphaerae]|uniref:Monovalent cation/H+ antiporter subunit D n=1 Tax=Larsenimonas rhizosphaerae TaxID=2944682 RepID=A0AA41ZDJ8_9GAMM|nr:monovalent cation/H+ antiporter subunit D [Larsenimonas rhizosphaerae]MCM2130165.1 monovalent cation/H+ antiporter subunit D [Larsenimonas rhizosphaerae]MCX2522852.1 monovalent cation/H+ antiporter subunit D [Larsenimonas rhizosphaerae]
MDHLLVLPIVLPLVAGLATLIRREVGTRYKRSMSVGATALLVVVAALLVYMASDGTIRYYALGGWQPPFGIIMVLDRLSAMMVLLTSVLALFCCIYACAGQDEEGSNFHGLFQLQLMGINGAFMTGDLFNLFVFFEVLLIASYALLMHGGGKARTQSGLHYVALNLAGSSLFLIALGVLYGTLGTLNMADMASRIAGLGTDRTGLVKSAGLLLLTVFTLKSAMLPLYFWLPRAYAAAPAAVAALFAIMTKVGIYAIIRVFSLLFGDRSASLADMAAPWLWWGGLATLALAAIGCLSARDMRTLVSYLILVSVGTLLTAVSLPGNDSMAALLYYMIQTTLVTGGLFLLADIIDDQRGKAGARIVKSRPLRQSSLLGGLFLVGMAGVAGLPPFSGAIGKALILQSAEGSDRLWLWPILLIGGLCTIVAASRAGSTFFWRSHEGEPSGPLMGKRRGLATLALIGAAPLLSILAGPLTHYTQSTAQQLGNPSRYLDAILTPTPINQAMPTPAGEVSP